jgi:hypothetical protein
LAEARLTVQTTYPVATDLSKAEALCRLLQARMQTATGEIVQAALRSRDGGELA